MTQQGELRKKLQQAIGTGLLKENNTDVLKVLDEALKEFPPKRTRFIHPNDARRCSAILEYHVDEIDSWLKKWFGDIE